MNTFSLVVEKVKSGSSSLAKESARMISFVAKLDDSATLKECKAQAAAVLAYLEQRRDSSVEEHNAAVKIKARVEHRLGEVLKETVKQGRPKKPDTVSGLNGELPEPISYKQSSRAQQLARVPWEEIEQKIDAKTQANEKASQTRVVKELLQEQQRKQEKQALEKAAKAAEKSGLVVDVRHCQMQEFLPSLTNIDAIITDPPYPKEFLPLYEELAKLAAQALTPDGILAVMCGQSYLPQIYETMAAHIPYRWTMAYLTPGGQAVQLWDRKVNTFWKPILLFGGCADWIGDVVKSAVNDNDKRFHNWGQSESGIADLIGRLTKPGQLICDPFLGAGTTGVVATALGRRFIGCDSDQDHVATAKKRILATRKE